MIANTMTMLLLKKTTTTITTTTTMKRPRPRPRQQMIQPRHRARQESSQACGEYWYKPGYVSDKNGCCHCRASCEEPSDDCKYYDEASENKGDSKKPAGDHDSHGHADHEGHEGHDHDGDE